MERTRPTDAGRPLRVVDAGATTAGRFTARLFALDGAQVTRIVPEGQTEPGESADPFLDCYLSAGVQVVRQATAAETTALLEAADVVLTGYDAGAHLGGFDDDVVRRHNPTVVHATTSSFGITGPYAARRGGPVADWAAGGYLHITGDPDQPPLMGPLHLCAYVAGYTAAVAVEAALVRVRDAGVGCHIDVSTMEAMLSVHQSTFERVAAGVGRTRTGRYTEVYPLTVRPCRDGHVALGVVTDAELDRLLIAIDRTDLLVDARFADPSARMSHRDELDDELAPFLLAHDAEQVVQLLQAHNVPAATVAGELDVLANPQLAARDFLRPFDCVTSAGRGPGDPVRRGDTSAWDPPAEVDDEWGRAPDTPGPGGTGPLDGLPLDGMLVLDLTAFWAGPSATRTLADLGARVITVERPGGRLDIDLADDAVAAEDLVAGLFHLSMNRGKESVVVDLRSEVGRSAVAELAARADVLVENFRPGVMGRFGLGPQALCGANPGLVYVSLSGFGSSGPWSTWGSYGPMIEAASSIEHRTGYEGGAPLRLGHTLPDGVGGLVGALAALRGLRRRTDGGGGDWYDISQLEAYIAVSGEEVLAASVRGYDRSRCGNRSSDALLQGVFPCAGEDEWVAVRAVDQRELDALVDIVDRLGGATSATAVPSPGAESAERRLAAACASRTKEDVAAALQAGGVEAIPVLTPDYLVGDRHLAARGFFLQAPFRGASVALAGSPLAATPPLVAVSPRAPRVGEHSLPRPSS
jgi:crotonobetainyl-CoA:carnitine CoA-transferase CaiB-like acyl-CoA transferase